MRVDLRGIKHSLQVMASSVTFGLLVLVSALIYNSKCVDTMLVPGVYIELLYNYTQSLYIMFDYYY